MAAGELSSESLSEMVLLVDPFCAFRMSGCFSAPCFSVYATTKRCWPPASMSSGVVTVLSIPGGHKRDREGETR